MLLYYITDRGAFPGDEASRRRALLARIAAAARAGVDLIQLREKDLPARQLEQLAAEAVRQVRSESAATRLLVNSRLDVALAVGTDGVHLTADDISPGDVRSVLATQSSQLGASFLVGVSCHSVDDVRRAQAKGASFAVLAPIFEKPLRERTSLPGIGLDALREAAHNCAPLPVLALGGGSLSNAAACLCARAAGIAGIRLFQQRDLAETVAALRRLAANP